MAVTAPQDHSKCPLAAVDQRLDDLHRQWHQAEAAYFDPDGFRVAIQTAIQTSRTVTFILQSNKRLFANFDQWYKPWQDKWRTDPLMCWMRDARNKIEKQGDLRAHSIVHAEIVASHLEGGPKIEVPAELFQNTFQLIKSIPQNELGDHIRKNGVVRIQRRWVENTLPDYELLDAVAIAYGRIAGLVHDAHTQLGLPAPVTQNDSTGATYTERTRDGRLPCMVGHAETRSLDIWLATGRPIKLTEMEHQVDLRDSEKLGTRYDLDPKGIFGGEKGPEGVLQNLFAAARKLFITDRHHVTVAFLLRGGRPVRIARLQLDEHGEMYLIMRWLANEVVRQDADAVILLGEVWKAPVESVGRYQGAADSPQRMEALSATLVTKTGEPITLSASIERVGTEVSLGTTEPQRGGAVFAFAPIYSAWGREIPKGWLDQSNSNDSGQPTS